MSDRLEAYRDLIRRKAEQYQLPPDEAWAVIMAESAGNPQAQSPKGALGLMQLMPETAADYGVAAHELLDPERNLDAGMPHLKRLMAKFPNQPDLWRAAYNAGEGNVAKYGGIPPFQETQDYVRRVADYAGQYQPAAAATPQPTATGSWATGKPEQTVTRLLGIWSGRDDTYGVDERHAPALQALASEIEEIPFQYADVRATTLYQRLSEVLNNQEIAGQLDPQFRASISGVRDLLWREMGGSNLAKGDLNLGGLASSTMRGLAAAVDPTRSVARRVDYPTEQGLHGGLSGIGSLLGYIAGGLAPIIGGAVVGGGPIGLAAGGAYAAGTQEWNRQAIQDRETAALRAALATPESLTRTRHVAQGLDPDALYRPRTGTESVLGVGGQAGIGLLTAPLAMLRLPARAWPGIAKMLGGAATEAGITALPWRQAARAALPLELKQLGVNMADMAASLGLMRATDPQMQQMDPRKLVSAAPEVIGMPFGLTAAQLLFPRGTLRHAMHVAAPIKPSQYQAQPLPTPAPSATATAQPTNRPIHGFSDLSNAEDIPAIARDILNQQVENVTTEQMEAAVKGIVDRGPTRAVQPDSPYFEGPTTQYYGRIPDDLIPESALKGNKGRHIIRWKDAEGKRHSKLINDAEYQTMKFWTPIDETQREWIATEPGDFIPLKRDPVKVAMPGHPDAVAIGTTREHGNILVIYKDAAGHWVRDEQDSNAVPGYTARMKTLQAKQEQALRGKRPPKQKPVIRKNEDVPRPGEPKPPIMVTPPRGYHSLAPQVQTPAPPPPGRRRTRKKSATPKAKAKAKAPRARQLTLFKLLDKLATPPEGKLF
jgi:hypothetical protein